MKRLTIFDLDPQEGEVIDFCIDEGAYVTLSDGGVSCGTGCENYASAEVQVPQRDFLALCSPSGKLIRAVGDSMIGAGIMHGDKMVVDPHCMPAEGDIVVADVEGEKLAKYYHYDRARKCVMLVPANDSIPVIEVKDPSQLRIIGVVTYSFRDTPAASPRALDQQLERCQNNTRLNEIIGRTAQAGYMDWRGEWKKETSQEFIAVWVNEVSKVLNIPNQWQWATSRWGVPNLRQRHYNIAGKENYDKYLETIKKIIA